MSDPTNAPSTLRKLLSLTGYLAAIGLLLFILFAIFFSIWSIFSTA